MAQLGSINWVGEEALYCVLLVLVLLREALYVHHFELIYYTVCAGEREGGIRCIFCFQSPYF
jgi:hypothetical protein